MDDMSLPRVLSISPESPAELAGISIADEFISINGRRPRDIIEYQLLVDEPELEIEITRGGLSRAITVEKIAGQPLGVEIESALFDQVRTCDNHCEFCFIYQLPKGMRRSLYMKDDDYRLSFLYGNFTTLTRFTEADLERVITERLSPLYVSIHSTNPEIRASLLHNKRGATSLRWLKELLKAGIEIHGQIVVCPGINDADRFEETLLGIFEEYSLLKTVAAVPLGISKFSKEKNMRSHTREEARVVVEIVEKYQEIFTKFLDRPMIFASDEYYLLANKPFPSSRIYDEFPQHENGIGMSRAFEDAFNGDSSKAFGVKSGFFASVDGAPAQGYRAVRVPPQAISIGKKKSDGQDQMPTMILTSEYGSKVIGPLVSRLNRNDIDVAVVRNEYFGGNIAVAGLMVGEDISKTQEEIGGGFRYLLPDVCLSEGRFLDGVTPRQLPFPVEIIKSDGMSLAKALARRQ